MKNAETAHAEQKAKPVAHLRMLAKLVTAGLLRPVGGHHEITDAGHEWARALIAELPTTSTFEGNGYD